VNEGRGMSINASRVCRRRASADAGGLTVNTRVIELRGISSICRLAVVVKAWWRELVA
jgi:hypothetical protein